MNGCSFWSDGDPIGGVPGLLSLVGLFSGMDDMTPPPPRISRGGFRSPFRGGGRGIAQVGYFFVSSFLVVGVQVLRYLW